MRKQQQHNTHTNRKKHTHTRDTHRQAQNEQAQNLPIEFSMNFYQFLPAE